MLRLKKIILFKITETGFAVYGFLGLSQDGVCTNLFENLSSIDTILNHPLFSLVIGQYLQGEILLHNCRCAGPRWWRTARWRGRRSAPPSTSQSAGPRTKSTMWVQSILAMWKKFGSCFIEVHLILVTPMIMCLTCCTLPACGCATQAPWHVVCRVADTPQQMILLYTQVQYHCDTRGSYVQKPTETQTSIYLLVIWSEHPNPFLGDVSLNPQCGIEPSTLIT